MSAIHHHTRQPNRSCLLAAACLLATLPSALAVDPPGDVAATAPSKTSVKLTWTVPGDEDGIEIERDGAMVKTLDAGATTWTDVGLTEGQTYVYQIVTVKDADKSKSKKIWALPTEATEFWPVKGLDPDWHAVGFTYCEYFDNYSPTDYHYGVDCMRVGDDATGKKTLVAPFSGRISQSWNPGGTQEAIELKLTSDYVSLWHMQSSKMGAADVGGWIMAGVEIGEVGNNAYGITDRYGAHSHVNRDTAPFNVAAPVATNMRHFLALYTSNALKDPRSHDPEVKDRTLPAPLDADTRSVQYKGDGAGAYIAAVTPATPPKGQPASAFIIKDKIDIVAEAEDYMGHKQLVTPPDVFEYKPASLYSIAYWVEAKARDSHNIRSAAAPYVLHKCSPHLFNGATEKTSEIYETGRAITRGWANDTCGHYVVTNTKGTDGAMANVDKAEHWYTKADKFAAGKPNGVGQAAAAKAEDAHFRDGHYIVHILASDLVRTKEYTDNVWVENFPPAVKKKKPAGGGGGFRDEGWEYPPCRGVGIEFSEPMNRESVEDAITFEEVGGSAVDYVVMWDAESYIVMLAPLTQLDPAKDYRVEIDADIARDLSGGTGGDGAYLDAEFGTTAHNGTSEGHPTDSVSWEFGGDEVASCEEEACCDVNCDGIVDAFDIDAFVELLTFHEPCALGLGDINCDGVVNNFDIDPFVAECLTGP